MSQLTREQRESLAIADADGRALVTLIDGRVAIILPPIPESQQAEQIIRIARALERVVPVTG